MSRDEERVNPNATRDHLANERTLLAWVRTSLGVIGLGFVIARFGLFLEEVGSRHHPHTWVSTLVGTALVLIGGGLMVPALRRYRRAASAIERNEYKHSSGVEVALGAGLVLVALALAAYLLITGL